MNLSLCLLTQNNAGFIDTCLASAEKWVDEIVIVDNGSTDDTVKKAQSHQARVICINHETHPDWFMWDEAAKVWFMADEAAMRNLAFKEARGDYLFWIDSDDTVEGSEYLQAIVHEMKHDHLQAAWFQYHYGFDSRGNLACSLPRERIIKRGVGAFREPTHTVHVRPQGPERFFDKVFIKHHRDLPDFVNNSPPVRVEKRAYRILKALYDKSDGNPGARTLFYLGNEARHFNIDEAIGYYEKYLRVSGWDEERSSARVVLGQIYGEVKGDWENAMRCYSAATFDYPDNPDGWFGLAKVAYFKEWWQRCIECTEKGFSLKDKVGLTFFNPLDRTFSPHIFYNFALNKVGRVKEALDSCNAALAIAPHIHLQNNKDVYERHLGLNKPTPIVKRELPPGSLDIAIWTGPAFEYWGPDTHTTQGMGGSEIACVEMARELAALGHHVTVYGNPKIEVVTGYGVTYRDYHRLDDAPLKTDVFICSRQAWMLNNHHVDAALKILWVHDIHCNCHPDLVRNCLPQFDRIFCLSHWHREFFLHTYPYLDSHRVLVSRNGINLSRFPEPLRPRGNLLIYTSDGPRGLEHLLDLFPKIQAEVPDVELDIYYGFDSWRASVKDHPEELAKIDRLLDKTRLKGVNFHGRVNQEELAQAFLHAKVWTLPSMFLETFCISAIEAQAAGCVPVVTGLAALNETVQSGFKVSPPIDEDYDRRFLHNVISLLRDDELRLGEAKAGVRHAQRFSWESLAKEWVDWFQRQPTFHA
jgi:glycosyltransferase involved in cell wall biosynthesis